MYFTLFIALLDKASICSLAINLIRAYCRSISPSIFIFIFKHRVGAIFLSVTYSSKGIYTGQLDFCN